MKRTRKIAIIGSAGYNQKSDTFSLESFSWYELDQIHNIKDYDFIVINLLPLENIVTHTINWDKFAEQVHPESMLSVLNSKGDIFFVGDPRFNISRNHPVKGKVEEPFLSWTGIEFTWDNLKGDTIEYDELELAFPGYTKRLTSWGYSLSTCQIFDNFFNLHSETKRIEINLKPVCWNRYGNALIFAIAFVLQELKSHRITMLRYQKRWENTFSSGHLIFLPKINLPIEQTLDYILKDIFNIELKKQDVRNPRIQTPVNQPHQHRDRRGQIVGPYKLKEYLGHGGYGEVWLAEQPHKIAPLVAVKLSYLAINKDLFFQEANLWLEVSRHNNVLQFIEAADYDGNFIIVSQYAPDGDLEKWLNQYRQNSVEPPLKDAIDLMSGILSGLDHIHKTLIHRDLKPSNVLLHGKTPLIADFGLAKVLGVQQHSGSIKGTTPYMSPEALRGERTIQTDIWSAGVIFYELLSGQWPFLANNDSEMIKEIINEIYEPLPPSIPQPLEQIISCALQKDPNKRFVSAKSMLDALLEVKEGL